MHACNLAEFEYGWTPIATLSLFHNYSSLRHVLGMTGVHGITDMYIYTCMYIRTDSILQLMCHTVVCKSREARLCSHTHSIE